MTNFEIGRRIVEHEQKGAKRAAYGGLLMHTLAERLTEEFGRGFYQIEATNESWSLPELRRQKASSLYHRLASDAIRVWNHIEWSEVMS